MNLPNRKAMRLPNYDYNQNGAYFITICTKNRRYLFSEVVGSIRESTLRNKSTISKVVGYLKMNTSKRVHKFNPDEDVWQISFYDHIIRDEKDYQLKWKYIDGNPSKWELDDYYV